MAKNDLQEIHEYLSEFGDNPPKKFRYGFERFCAQVVRMPQMFSQYEQNFKYRIAVIAYGYLVFYRFDENSGSVNIYRVLHGKRAVELLIGD